MRTYFLTVYKQDGTNIINETFEAENDKDASAIGKGRLAELGYEEQTHRCAAPEGHLVLFHR